MMVNMKDYTFKNYNDLSRLPYFTIKDNRLILADKSKIGPIIDIQIKMQKIFFSYEPYK